MNPSGAGSENTGKSLADMRKILEMTRSMSATADLDSLLTLTINRSVELMSAERASVFLHDAATGELVSRVASGVKELRIPSDRGLAGETFRSGHTIVVPDAYADGRFNPQTDKATGFRTRNLLSAPLRDHDGAMIGVLQVLNKVSGDFTDDDVLLAETFAAQAGAAIQRANLIEHYLAKKEMERAMRIARQIQRDLLPRGEPEVAGFDVAGFSMAADETGGDTYDFMPLACGRLMVSVADATGHGIGPALVIAETRAMLRALMFGQAGPGGTCAGEDCTDGKVVGYVLRTVNALLAADLGGSHFVTCFLGLLDGAGSRLIYASAGHGPLVFYSRADDKFQTVSGTGLPLGVMDAAEYDTVLNREFAPGDFAAITTDGIFEAASAAGEEFGVPRMLECLRAGRNLSAADMIDALVEAVRRFAGGGKRADDITAVIIRKK